MQSRKPGLIMAAMIIFITTIFTYATIATASAKDVAAQAATCSACHGADGHPVTPDIPNIWGQKEGYIYLELRDMKSGDRKNELMAPLLAGMSKDDMMALAAYFSSKPWPDLKNASATSADAAIGGALDTSIGCTACHGANYKGDSTVPRLASQSAAYLQAQMLAFRSGARANNPGMTALMKQAKPDQLKAMARYLAGS